MELYLELDVLLINFVNELKKETKSRNCSIYLKENESGYFILSQSTSTDAFLGNDTFYVPENATLPKPDEQKNIGLLNYSVIKKEDIFIKNIHNKKDSKVKYWIYSTIPFDELPLSRIDKISAKILHSFIVVPLIDKTGQVFGVVRLITTKDPESLAIDDYKDVFNTKDFDFVKEYVKKNKDHILNAIKFSYLLEYGSNLELEVLCDKIVQNVNNFLDKPLSCSIFLREVNGNYSKENSIKFCCKGTTGLFSYYDNANIIPINDITKIYYDYNPNEVPKNYTTAVIKSGLNIINKEINKDFDELSFPVTITRSKPKYVGSNDTLKNSFIIIPLFTSKRYSKSKNESDVFGVIQITKKADFQDEEIRYLTLLFRKLSKVILFCRFFNSLNGQFDNFSNQSNILLETISELIGSQKTSLLERSLDENFNNFQMKVLAKHGGKVDSSLSYPIPHDVKDYHKDDDTYIGFTTWIACFKQALRYNNPSELDNPTSKYKPKPVHRKGNDAPPRFLGVPIIYNKEVLGVLRSAREENEPKFTSNDEILLSSIADILAPYFKNREIKSSSSSKNKKIIKKKFGKALFINLQNFINQSERIPSPLDSSIKKILRELYLNDNDYFLYSEEILNFTYQLWGETQIVQHDKGILKNLKLFNEQILSQLPGYRDHFDHQFQVFLLGYYIIKESDRIAEEKTAQSIPDPQITIQDKDKYKSFKHNVNESKKYGLFKQDHINLIKKIYNCEIPESDIIKTWLLISTFHDLAYPIQEVHRWLPKIISTYFGDTFQEKIPDIPIHNIFFNNSQYFNYLNNSIEFYLKLDLNNGCYKKEDFLKIILATLPSRDHGVLSSLLLQESVKKMEPQIIFPSALAIALHKKFGQDLQKRSITIPYTKFPLFSLLAYCDLIQEWNRDFVGDKNDSNFIELEEICITNDISNINNNYAKEMLNSLNLNKDTLIIYTHLSVSIDSYKKIEECKQWLSFIQSTNPFYCVQVNDIFISPL